MTFVHAAFRLEPRESCAGVAYGTTASRGDSMASGPNRTPTAPGHETVRAATAAGKRMTRVRVVSEPWSDYTKFGMYAARDNIEAGEDIHYLPRPQATGHRPACRTARLRLLALRLKIHSRPALRRRDERHHAPRRSRRSRHRRPAQRLARRRLAPRRTNGRVHQTGRYTGRAAKHSHIVVQRRPPRRQNPQESLVDLGATLNLPDND
jgi:hypothetical protein